MNSVNKKLVSAFIATVLICALIMPAVSVAPVEADDGYVIYFRVMGRAGTVDEFAETGEYQTIFAGEVTVPMQYSVQCTSPSDGSPSNQYEYYINETSHLTRHRLPGGSQPEEYYDMGEVTGGTGGATAVLAALITASDQGSFTYGVTDAYIDMGQFVYSIAEQKGQGVWGWCYRVWNSEIAYSSPCSCDNFLLGYDNLLSTPHTQVLWYWSATGKFDPLKVEVDKTTVVVGEEFTAAVEYYKDGSGWLPAPDATVAVGGETFTTGDNGDVKIFLESEGIHHLVAKKGLEGGTCYVDSDDRTTVTVSGGTELNWWTQTSQADFGAGTPYQVDSSGSPGDVKLERGGTVTEDYILNGGSDTLGGEHFYDEFKILGGATLNVLEEDPLIVHANYIKVDSTSSITADGKGYAGAVGDIGGPNDGCGTGGGGGGLYKDDKAGGGGGGGYGGKGRNGGNDEDVRGPGGATYGGTCYQGDHTFYMGSGGGGGAGAGDGISSGGSGGNGGGAVMLEAETVIINGNISANGSDGAQGDSNCGSGGGGSGGTIYIAGSSITIANGVLSVGGGTGADDPNDPSGDIKYRCGGGGGGGRIKVFYEICNDSSGHDVSGGESGEPYENGWRHGFPGSGSGKSYWKEETYSPTLPYFASGTLESAAYDTTYSADFGEVQWCSATPSGTEVKFQIATNNDNATWDFKGIDGTGDTYYETSGTPISGHDGNRYIKYKAFFSTSEPGDTPTLSKVGITYSEQQGEVISFTVTDYNNDGIKFGNIDPGQTDQPADWGGSQGAVTLTIGAETNVDVGVYLKGDNFTVSGNTLAVTRVKYDDDSTLGEGTETGDPEGVMATTYDASPWYTVLASTADTHQVYHWISIPGGQVAGDYTSTFYYQAIKSA